MDRRGMDFFNELSVISSYKKIMKRIDPDIILSFTIKPNIYGAYVANKFAKPIIINITGLGSAFNNLKILPFIKLMYKNACKKAYSVFFQNVGNYEYFIKNNLVSDSKTILLPGSGVNIDGKERYNSEIFVYRKNYERKRYRRVLIGSRVH